MTRFVLSTTICGSAPLVVRDLEAFRRHGFDAIELAAAPGHVDLRTPAGVGGVREAIRLSGVELNGLAVPWPDAPLAVAVAVELGCPRVVVHAARCRAHPGAQDAPADAAALRRTLEPLAANGARHGVAVAVEFPARWSADTIIDLLESLDEAPIGVCLDVGHAHLAGGAPEAIEALSGYLVTTCLHDNQGRDDSHRPPYSGAIDWPAALMSLWKTGFAGPSVIDVLPDPDMPSTLARAVGARTRLQAILDDLAQPMVFPE